MSTPAVHPVETPPVNNVAPPRMRDLQGMPGTIGSLILRLCQFGFAVVAMCVMVTTSDFPTVTAFSYLVAAVGLQIIWSLVLAIADVYAILVQRSFRNAAVVSLFTIGDGHGTAILLFHNFDMLYLSQGSIGNNMSTFTR
ncbi:CASP-like protein 5A1 isoform X3 [Capsicum annuum]|uniref:CASP-like protein 5A1 isoform X3 n=1 Tax=Capsicum annuum TaxID=4072 RepID=UPI001FB0E246|nr:CASP-like protein 5A1 isoform X3 [Capsicum annuum]XP_047254592.1 CASP-like protein 5A1 isoform X3 [Capsicum annuum]